MATPANAAANPSRAARHPLPESADAGMRRRTTSNAPKFLSRCSRLARLGEFPQEFECLCGLAQQGQRFRVRQGRRHLVLPAHVFEQSQGLVHAPRDEQHVCELQPCRVPGGAVVARMRLADKKMEIVLNFKGIRRVVDERLGGLNLTTWVGVAPDGSVLLTRDVGTQEIYALDVPWP